MQQEQLIKVAAKLYDCRSSCKKIYGDDYAEMSAEYQQYIRAYMQRHNEANELMAAMKLIEEYAKQDGGVFSVKIFAACIDLIEANGTPDTLPDFNP
jgi:aromatic ring hydroxylase